MIAPEFNGTPSTEEYRAYLALLLREVFIGTAETVPLYHAAGRILAQDVTARMDVPSFDNSQMDGYALTAEAAERERPHLHRRTRNPRWPPPPTFPLLSTT